MRILNRGIALKLQKEGYQVFSAFQISEAEKLFDENRIDLVISDYYSAGRKRTGVLQEDSK